MNNVFQLTFQNLKLVLSRNFPALDQPSSKRRLVVYRSSSLDRRKAAALDRTIATARRTLEAAAEALQAEGFACEADAQRAAAAWAARPEAAWFTPMTTVQAETRRVPAGCPPGARPAPQGRPDPNRVARDRHRWGPPAGGPGRRPASGLHLRLGHHRPTIPVVGARFAERVQRPNEL